MKSFWILLLALPLFSKAQQLRKIVQLPEEFNEISGMVTYDGSTIYAINDGGNTTELLIYDTFSEGVERIFIANATNVDWEDLAQDDSGNLFIGDFGNNLNTRKALTVYKVANPLKRSSDTLIATPIHFKYGDQHSFPPSENRLIYDCEAMIWLNDSLYLFTKNRTNPYDGFCHVYALAALPGTHTAVLKDSVYIGGAIKELGWIAGADFSNGTLALLGYSKLHLWSQIENNNFFRGIHQEFNLGGVTQKESVCFIPQLSNALYIADEKYIGGPNLYVFSRELGKINKLKDPFKVRVTSKCFRVSDCEGSCTLEVYRLSGEQYVQKSFTQSIELQADRFSTGIYLIRLKNEENSWAYKWLIR